MQSPRFEPATAACFPLRSGLGAAGYALAVDLHLHPPAHAVIIGRHADPRTRALWQAVLAAFRPGKIIAAYDPAAVRAGELPPAVAAAMRNVGVDGVPQAYVCVGDVCALPTTDPLRAATLVSTFEHRAAPTEDPSR